MALRILPVQTRIQPTLALTVGEKVRCDMTKSAERAVPSKALLGAGLVAECDLCGAKHRLAGRLRKGGDLQFLGTCGELSGTYDPYSDTDHRGCPRPITVKAPNAESEVSE
jgi:hypothetical protein